MTRTANARVAGLTFLLYIAVAFASMVLLERATSGKGTAAKLASIAQHTAEVRVAAVLSLLGCFSALVLAVTLYAITREVDADLAVLALTCRVAEGVISGISIPETLGLLWLATAMGENAPDPGATHVLGGYLLRSDVAVTATFFAVGSALFSYLFVRGRMIPVALAWLGLLASVLLVVLLPLQVAGVLRGSITQLMYLPMLAFEVSLGLWLLIKGVAAEPVR
jgi:hypothetical protein